MNLDPQHADGADRGATQFEPGVALIAVLVALTLLLLLALPFSIGMSIGYDAAVHQSQERTVELASQSVRDQLLADAGLSTPDLDITSPTADGLDEFPDSLKLPKAFADLAEGGRVLLGGEVEDLQRRIDLDSATPLLLANLLGTACRLAEPLTKEATALTLVDAGNLPAQGYVMVDLELIHYGSKQGNVLEDLQRGLLAIERGFQGEEHEVQKGALVLDYRCVIAVCWPFTGRGDGRAAMRRPFADVGELVQVAEAGFGGFSAGDMEIFARTLAVGGGHQTAPIWGRPERVFNELDPDKKPRVLRIESGLQCGAGATVRLRSLRTGTVEYGLVLSSSTPPPGRIKDLLLPSEFHLVLHTPVQQPFAPIDTVVEPLVPVPVNVNTASREVLQALWASLQRGGDVRLHDGSGGDRSEPPPALGRSEVADMVDQILALRSDTGGDSGGPFSGWQDFVERFYKPLLDAASSTDKKQRLMLLYRDMLTGRDARLEMGTLPICFTSGPWVHYRAAASASPLAGARSVAARMERQGTAVAMPGLPLRQDWGTQQLLEEAFRLDQRSPGYLTTPVNTGAILPTEAGNDPASRLSAHLLAHAYPEMGFGQPRFPSPDRADSGFMPAPASTPPGNWIGERAADESFALSLDPLGRDLSREGVYLVRNTGPRPGAGQAPAATMHAASFPFTTDGGVCSRFGTSFWLTPEGWGTQTLLDYSDGDRERNCVSVRVRDANLLLEVIDEAGLDPAPSKSTTQVARTAGEYSVPLSELGLAGRTPLHVNVGAYGNRPGQLSMLLDGFPRGKASYRTYLTAPLGVYDRNSRGAVPIGQDSEQYTDLTVESTDGFPKQGVLRIGTELFEYTSINGNSFRGTFVDSMGGRIARQVLREFRPDIPVDDKGNPSIDIDSQKLAQSGLLDVAPEHPVGSAVELYGYSLLPSFDTVMQVGETATVDALGGFSIARATINNARIITAALPPPSNGTLPVGRGLDENSTDDLLLFDPIVTSGGQPPSAQRPEVLDGFPQSGGFALLVQFKIPFQASPRVGAPTTGTPVLIGGIEPIRYGARQGNKLTGIQRNVRLPGIDAQIDPKWYDGRARKFITDWENNLTVQNGSVTYDEVPYFMLFVVPISLPVQSPSILANPEATGTVEWVQLYPKDAENDTEFVCYDSIQDNRHLVRSNRQRWDEARRRLTGQIREYVVTLQPNGPNNDPTIDQPWGKIQPTSGYIGYIPQLESDLPQIYYARQGLAFRGDPRTGTSSHPQRNSVVLPCHRLQLHWGNYGALTGRAGRQDRVALVAGSQGTGGSGRPSVEWHTVNWVYRRFGSDDLQEDRTPPELLGRWPFQLVAFKERVAGLIQGPVENTDVRDPRLYDRMVKFPSGELPTAYCAEIAYGATVGNSEPVRGILDEVHVVQQAANDVLVDESFAADARSFRVRKDAYLLPSGLRSEGRDETAAFPPGGGLVQIDAEILGYLSRDDGVFTLANDARGLLGTEARGHDRGAVVRFLTHVPAAVLAAGISAQSDVLTVQALGALPAHGGALLNGNEVLHYTWVRHDGDRWFLEMPRYFRDGEDGTSRGLFRGRFGTTPQAQSQGAMLIGFPIRYWDRQVERSEDPEQHYFQLSSMQAPVFWKALSWRQETTDSTVELECLCRLDGKPAFADDPQNSVGLLRFQRLAGDDKPSLIGREGALLEARFQVIYRPGCLDLQTHMASGYKTTIKVKDVWAEYEGQGRIVDEKVTAR